MLVMSCNKIIQHYLDTQGLDQSNIKNGKIIKKQQKNSEQKNHSINFVQIENTCDRIINNIDKLLNYLKQ